MTRAEAEAEARRKQRSHPDAKWLATQQGDEWVVARIGLTPTTTEPLATTIKPPPPTPHSDPQSELQRVTTQFGSAG
jgi:hypothetical protein